MKKVVFLFIFLLVKTWGLGQVPERMNLDSGWILHWHGQDSLIPAKVPGNLYVDLYAAGIIPAPYDGDNEKHIQWIANKNPVYEKHFNLTGSMLRHKEIYLVFEGLDTYADVWLNDSLILRANNMFRKWQVPVKQLLKTGNNILIVKFYSPLKADSLAARKYFVKLPDSRAFTRKSPYQYGWDWGARLITSGIWRNVYLQGFDYLQIKDFSIKQNSIDSSLARLTAQIEIASGTDTVVDISLSTSDSTVIFTAKERLHKGLNIINRDFEIKNPRLWMPRGYGQPNLYTFVLTVGNNDLQLRKQLVTGLRTVKLIRRKDTLGTTFYFTVNGQRIFAKGANYIPQDQFPSQVSRQETQKLLTRAANTGFNMLRVWGGGYYLDDWFYHLCDSLGIMIWQDFMFACNFYPVSQNIDLQTKANTAEPHSNPYSWNDSLFTVNIAAEASEQVRRLRNHPSVVLWCGNNEVYEAWFNWGYQKALAYTPADSARLWHKQRFLFDTLLRHIVTANTDVPYIPTSPQIGWGHKEAYANSDVHFWGVWWARWPFEEYISHTGRFMSEYGFQAFPDIKTILAVVDTADLWLDSPQLLNHQKHPFGMENIQNYMLRYFGLPHHYAGLYHKLKNIPAITKPYQGPKPFFIPRKLSEDQRIRTFEQYVFYSQLTQAYGISTAIEAHRRAKPYCMGTLYWQFNDSWPVISWSGIDYYGRPKALHYRLKQLFATILISPQRNGDSTGIYITSDSLRAVKAKLEIAYVTTSGLKTFETKRSITIPADTSLKITSLKLTRSQARRTVIDVKLITQAGKTFERVIFPSYPRQMKLKKPHITMHVQKNGTTYLITLTTNVPVYSIMLKSSADGHFDKNFFPMLPGRTYTVRFTPLSGKKPGFDYLVYPGSFQR